MILTPSSKIYLADSTISGAGLGVFAREDIKKGELIEESPVLVIPGDELANLTKTKLFDYYFAWGKGFKDGAVALGLLSMYNHSYKPNAKYIKNLDSNTISFVAIKDIKKELEILVNYNGHPDDQTKLWFLVRDKY